jgi:chromosome segregation ATPase
LRTKISEKIHKLKEEYNKFKLDFVQQFMNLKKQNIDMFNDVIEKIKVGKINTQQKEAKYHEKNTKMLLKLENELVSKSGTIEKLEKSTYLLKDQTHGYDMKISDLNAQHQSLENEYKICLQTISEKSHEIQRLKFGPSRSEELALDTEKLTLIISEEIQKKYKEKLIQVIALIEQTSGIHKSKLDGIQTKVGKIETHHKWELDHLEKENRDLISKNYHTHQKRSDLEQWKHNKDNKIKDLDKSLRTVLHDLKDKEIQLAKAKGEKKLILDSSIRLKKDLEKYKQNVSLVTVTPIA